MKKIIIEIDTLPLNTNPLLCVDYVGRQIVGAVYERLIPHYNCKIVKISKYQYLLILLHQSFTVDCYIETFNFHKFNNSPFSYFFQLIKYKKQSDYQLLFILEQNYPYDFMEVLEASFFVPLSQDKLLNNGPYQLKSIGLTEIILIPNLEYWNKTIEQFEIVFFLNKDFNRTKELYEQNRIMVTSNTHFNYELLESYKDTEELNITASNLIFLFEVKDNNLKNHIIMHLDCIQENKVLSTLLVAINSVDKKIPSPTIENKKIKILYTTFYPNEIVINELVHILSKLEISIELTSIDSFEEFVNLNKEEFDIVLHLITPFLKDINSLFKVCSKQKLKDQDIFDLISYKTKYLPIFMGKSIFLKKRFLDLTIDKLGQINYEKIVWRNSV